MTYNKEHLICPVQTEYPIHTDTVLLSNKMHFEQISAVIGVQKEVLEKLKMDPNLSSIPVALFTAVDHAGSDKRAREMGVAGTIRKPFHLQQVLGLIREITDSPGDGV